MTEAVAHLFTFMYIFTRVSLFAIQVLAQSKVASLPLFGMLSELELGLVSGEVLLGLLLKSPVLKTLLFEVSLFLWLHFCHNCIL